MAWPTEKGENAQERCAISIYHDRLSPPQLAKSLLFSSRFSLYSSNCIRDSFIFAGMVGGSNLDTSSVFLCTYLTSSLFTNGLLLAATDVVVVVDIYPHVTGHCQTVLDVLYTFPFIVYFVLGRIRICLGVSSNPMFL